MLAPVPERDDLYRILQVDPAASPLVIQAAYRVLAQIFHPDVDGDDEQMKRINAAWHVLRDPDRRIRYDAERRRASGIDHRPAVAAPMARPTTAAAPTPAGPTAAGATAPSASRPLAEDHAGPPQGPAFGTVLRFGRYEGWSLGQVARVDRPFLEWLRRVPAGRTIKDEIDRILRETESSPSFAHRRRDALSAKHVHTWAPGARTSTR